MSRAEWFRMDDRNDEEVTRQVEVPVVRAIPERDPFEAAKRPVVEMFRMSRDASYGLRRTEWQCDEQYGRSE